MRAMVLERLAPLADEPRPLRAVEIPDPQPAPGELLLDVTACGVCHTELDEIEGRTPPSSLPRTLGHQVVGRIAERGEAVAGRRRGERVGVAWIRSACGECEACRRGEENLCPQLRATGRDADGGYAERMVVPAPFAVPIPEALNDVQAAPLLCAGAIGLRSLRLAGLENGQRLGLTGFGASAHLVLPLARHLYPASEVFVFARAVVQRELARELGAAWAGDTDDVPPARLHAIIDTTPAWKPVVDALARLEPGGRLVINAIRKEADDRHELLRLDYAEHLWLEKEIKSVANVTRRDVEEVLALALAVPLRPTVAELPLEQANEALQRLRSGGQRGALVLRMA